MVTATIRAYFDSYGKRDTMKVTKKLLPLALFTGVMLFTSCSKDDELDGGTLERADATLTWSGDYAVDGCGFTLQIGEEYHKPVNESDIAASYKENFTTEVEVKFINYNRSVKTCQTNVNRNKIKILDIREKL